MASITERVFRSTGRHFVTLSCVFTSPNSSEERTCIYSGFLFKVLGLWFYITAGHVIREIEAATKAGFKFDVWRLGDQTAGNRFKNVAIPYSFNLDNWLVVENEDSGLDYAAVPLDQMSIMNLEAGGAQPLDKESWGDHVTEFDHWILVGMPSESVNYDNESVISGRVVLALLDSCDAPDSVWNDTANRFYARLQEGSEAFVKSVVGMSGGPIFALKKINGEWRYNVIGVQSSWFKNIRTIAACPISSFGLAIEKALSEDFPELADKQRGAEGAA